MNTHPFLARAAGLAVFLPGVAVLAAPLDSNPELVSGMAVPGRAGTHVFSSVSMAFGVRGNVIAITAKDDEGLDSSGIWVNTGAGYTLVAFDGMKPSNDTASFFSIGNGVLNASGGVAFTDVEVGSSKTVGGVITALTLPGNAPGTTQAFEFGGTPVIADDGTAAFQALLHTSGTGIWSDAFSGGTGVQLLAETGLLVDPSVPGVTYDAIGANLRMSNGKILASPNISFFGVDVPAIVTITASGGTVVARLNGPAPTPAGTQLYTALGQPFLSPTGHFVFESSISATGVQATSGIFGDVGTGVQSLLLADTVAPGVAGMPGVTTGVFSRFQSTVMNNSDRLAFTAQLDSVFGLNGVWSNGITGATALVALQGQAAPDVAGRTFSSFTGLAMGDNGRIAFKSLLTDGSATIDSLYAQDSGGILRLVAFVGETFNVAPGEPTGIISQIQFGNIFDQFDPEQAYSGNTLVYWLQFQDGRTGVYSVSVVPEPGSLAALSLGGALLLRRGRVKRRA